MDINTHIHSDLSEILHNYWEKLVGKILVSGLRSDFPCEGSILSAFNEIKFNKPELEYFVEVVGNNHGSLFQQGSKIQEIKICKFFDSGHSIELLINFQATLRLFLPDLAPFSISSPSINLQETLRNFNEFVEKFPLHLEKLESVKTECLKKSKIIEMSKNSIRASVSQVLSQTPYEWVLTDWGEYFSLQICMGKKKIVSLSLNYRNFVKRISSLAEALAQVDSLLKVLPFSMDISMTKEFVKL